MGQARVEEEIAASPDAVWDLVRDFGGIKRWNPTLDDCQLDRPGVGGVRTITMAGATVRERLETLDEQSRTMSYAILEAPLPVSNYLATVQLSPAGPNRTRIVWSSIFEPAGVPEEQLVQIFTGIYQAAIAGMRAALS